MEPVKNARCNFTYKGPTPDIADLPCRREVQDGMVVIRSYWKPSPEELFLLARGGTIVLGIFTEPIPPVSLGVVFTSDDIGRASPPESVPPGPLDAPRPPLPRPVG